jgi:phosphatidylglycerophosphatase A
VKVAGQGVDAAAGPPVQRRRTLADHLAVLLATWFGCGFSPVAPGTAGTLGAVPLYLLVAGLGPWAVAAAAVLLTGVGVAASTRVANLRGLKDPQLVCIDEVAGVFVAFTAAAPTFGQIAAAVLLFRVFDILKPWPARRLERLPGGWGIVFDDLAAGLWAALLIVLYRLAAGSFP